MVPVAQHSQAPCIVVSRRSINIGHFPMELIHPAQMNSKLRSSTTDIDGIALGLNVKYQGRQLGCAPQRSLHLGMPPVGWLNPRVPRHPATPHHAPLPTHPSTHLQTKPYFQPGTCQTPHGRFRTTRLRA